MRDSEQRRAVFLGAWVLLFATACLPAFTTLQRATTLEPGQTQVAVVASALAIVGTPIGETPEPDPTAPPTSNTPQVVPNAELAVRRGLLPNVDAGLRLWFTGLGLGADVKWRFLHTEHLQVALAPAVSIDLLSLMAGAQGTSNGGAMLAAYLPLIVGVRTGPHELLFGFRGVGAVYLLKSGSTASNLPILVPGGFVGYDFEVLPWLHIVPEVDAYCAPSGAGCFFTGAVAFWFP